MLIVFLLSFKHIIINGTVKINIYIPLFLKNIIMRMLIINNITLPLLIFLLVTKSYNDTNKDAKAVPNITSRHRVTL